MEYKTDYIFICINTGGKYKMKNLHLLLILLSITFLYGCPQNLAGDNNEEYNDEYTYEEEEVYEQVEEDDPTHLENPGDIGGSLIF